MNLDVDYSGMAQNWIDDGNMLAWPMNGLGQGPAPSVSTFGNTFQFPLTIRPGPAQGTSPIFEALGPSVSTFSNMFQFPSAISTTTGADVSTNVSPASGTTAVDTPHNTSQSPNGDKTGATDLDRNSVNALPNPEIQREKPRKGRSKASCAMYDSGNSLIAELEGVLPNDNPLDRLNVPGSEGETRRSARTIVPSKRCEQMNQIRTKNAAVTSASVDKENIPPNSRPNWAITTQDHLLGMELGAEWRACVYHWVELEEILGYGAVTGTRVSPFTQTLSSVS